MAEYKMADKYVKLDDVIEILENEWGYDGIRDDLYNLQTADVQEVIRCKDCKFYKKDTDYCKKHNKGYCDMDNVIKQEMHFCGYGERKYTDESENDRYS